jgi:hypothetical protein
VAFCADAVDPRGFESSRLSSQFAGMMWRPCRVYSAWALAWCPARPRRRHDIMAPRSGFQFRPSLAVENSAPSAPARRPDARAARRAAWRHLSRDPGVRKRPARRAQGGDFKLAEALGFSVRDLREAESVARSKKWRQAWINLFPKVPSTRPLDAGVTVSCRRSARCGISVSEWSADASPRPLQSTRSGEVQ